MMAKKKTKKAPARKAPKTARPVKRGRKPSKFARVTGGLKKKVKNRFQKFYVLHRPAINNWRRSSYKTKKKQGICVKCKKKALKTSIFCAYHLAKSRVYNRR